MEVFQGGSVEMRQECVVWRDWKTRLWEGEVNGGTKRLRAWVLTRESSSRFGCWAKTGKDRKRQAKTGKDKGAKWEADERWRRELLNHFEINKTRFSEKVNRLKKWIGYELGSHDSFKWKSVNRNYWRVQVVEKYFEALLSVRQERRVSFQPGKSVKVFQ